jgi:uncharacterized protein (TIRG00374 family)
LKLAITAGLLALVAGKIDLRAVTHELRQLKWSWAAAAAVLLFAQLLLTGLRWHIVSGLVAAPLRVRQALRLVLVGQFFNQVLPTSVGGDAVRAWMLSRESVLFERGLLGIICDRVVAVVVLAVVVAITIGWLSRTGLHVPLLDQLAILVPALTGAGLLFVLVLGERFNEMVQGSRLLKPVGALVRSLRYVVFFGEGKGRILVLALTVQALMVLVLVTCSMAISSKPGIVQTLLFPAILLISMVPVSFAGWGMREGAMVVVLGFAGTPAAEALAISLVYGLAQIVIGLPGAVIWLLWRRHARMAESSAGLT